ncbi:MAG: hypothetical protein ACYDEV_10035 [Acidiferrobacter sp.]
MLELSHAAIEAFPQSLFFSGRIVDSALHTHFRHLLHGDIGFVIQDYIEKEGFTMMIIPVNIPDDSVSGISPIICRSLFIRLSLVILVKYLRAIIRAFQK